MIRILNQIPKTVIVATSGGVDSMAVLHFLLQGKRNVKAAFFHHGEDFSNIEEELIRAFCKKHSVELLVSKIVSSRSKRDSLEEHWRNERYKFLESLNEPVITCHHLDDVLETWIFSFLHGQEKLIPYQRNNIIRPFLLTEKKDLVNWTLSHYVPFFHDPTNEDTSKGRNQVRHNIIPEVLKLNPGIKKQLVRRIIEKYKYKGQMVESGL